MNRHIARLAAAFATVGALAAFTVAGCSSSTNPTDSDASTCTGGQTACGNACVDLQKDLSNCGACGTACKAGEVCSQGACATSCGGGTTKCGQTCADTKVDPANCGACGKACGAGELCAAGQCMSACGQGQTACSGDGGAYCANVKTDNANCGACGKTCGQGQVCSNGTCSSSCGMGQTFCTGDGGAYCASTQTDNANCGSCGNTCGQQQVCAGGMCSSTCLQNQTLCTPDGGAPYCANTQTDNTNCGSCGTTCGAQQTCVNGMCSSNCVQNQTLCTPDGGAPYCANTQTDNANCGVCGKTCSNGQSCIMGACISALGSCKAIHVAFPQAASGVYTISPNNTNTTVYCDMTTDGGGWTLLLNRITESDNLGQPDVTSAHGAFDNNRATNWNIDFTLLYPTATDVAFAVKHDSACANCAIGGYDSALKFARQPANALTLGCNAASVGVTITKLVGPNNGMQTTAYVCANSIGWGVCGANVICHYGVNQSNTTSDGNWSWNNPWYEMHFPSANSSYKSYTNASGYCRSCGGGLNSMGFNPVSSTCCDAPNNPDASTWTIWLR